MRRIRLPKRLWFRETGSKILFWSAFAGVILGVLGLGRPVEDVLRTFRNATRPYDASGQIVVVGIDDKSMAALGRWPWPRRTTGALVDRLNALGASEIYFDTNFSGPTNAIDDNAFAASLRRSKHRVTIGTRFALDPRTNLRTDAIASSPFDGMVNLGLVTVRWNYAGQFWTLPYAMTIAGKSYPSLSAQLAGTKGVPETFYPLDYALRLNSIPTVSASDVMASQHRIDSVRGKKVIVGLTSPQLGDLTQIMMSGAVPAVYGHVIGAETLSRGSPLTLGWLPMFLLGLVVAAICRFLTSRKLKLIAVGCAVVGILAIPIFLESRLIFVEVFPALMVILGVYTDLFWASAKRTGTLFDASSGLPNLNALRDRDTAPNTILVAVRIRNFADIVSSLPVDVQNALIAQIVMRLATGTTEKLDIYQGDDGVFVWLHDARLGDQVCDHIEGLHALLLQPINVDDRSVDLQLSFGLERDGNRALANRIGSALYAADEAAKDGARWHDFNPELLKTAEWRLSMLGQLDKAITDHEIWIAYQPQLDVQTGIICGAEALARWRHPVRGEIMPDDFIVIAEETGRIERLTLFVLDETVLAAVSLNRISRMRASVNLSASLLDSPYLARVILALLEERGLPTDLLTLEVTETAQIRRKNHPLELLHELRKAGVGISIDDYGTGQSTLDYVRRIPATEIKIDKTFITTIEHDLHDRAMVESTIVLARTLGRTIVAEGVETETVLDLLQEMGCPIAQGYFIGKPMRLGEFADLRNGNLRAAAA